MPDDTPATRSAARTPWQQRFLDDIFLITVAGLIIPTVFYIVLGLLSLTSVPVFTP
ncbi:MAG: hypothetical protein IT306_23835 [Chloroflexi bacterium]|nr:hypothetical protein [Chloroflexota bacterium]